MRILLWTPPLALQLEKRRLESTRAPSRSQESGGFQRGLANAAPGQNTEGSLPVPESGRVGADVRPWGALSASGPPAVPFPELGVLPPTQGPVTGQTKPQVGTVAHPVSVDTADAGHRRKR